MSTAKPEPKLARGSTPSGRRAHGCDRREGDKDLSAYLLNLAIKDFPAMARLLAAAMWREEEEARLSRKLSARR
jgi:hypothetical protein